jgi:Domain of unknown function (DUF4286)
MIVYNVTTKVEHSVAEAWLTWLQEEHIPDIIATGCFTHAVILHLLEVDDIEGVTYAVQYHAANKALYDRYLKQFADEMRSKAMEKWGNKFIAFRSLMEVVH